jgi:hypothetical protein
MALDAQSRELPFKSSEGRSMRIHRRYLRTLGEDRIAEARPVGSIAAACGLAAAGMIVISMSPLFPLTGLFVGGPILWIGVAIVGVGVVWFVVARGVYRGYLWGWFGAVLLAVLSLALAWWMNQVGSRVLSYLGTMLMVDHFAVLLMLWRRPVRDWFFESHRVRADGYNGTAVELKGIADS